MRIPRCRAGALALALLVSCGALAAERTATLHEITAQGEAGAVGTITFTDTAYGLLVTPDLQGLASGGAHGMHIHANGACGPREGSRPPRATRCPPRPTRGCAAPRPPGAGPHRVRREPRQRAPVRAPDRDGDGDCGGDGDVYTAWIHSTGL